MDPSHLGTDRAAHLLGLDLLGLLELVERGMLTLERDGIPMVDVLRALRVRTRWTRAMGSSPTSEGRAGNEAQVTGPF